PHAGRDRGDAALRHPLHRGGPGARGPHRGAVGVTRPGQTDHRAGRNRRHPAGAARGSRTAPGDPPAAVAGPGCRGDGVVRNGGNKLVVVLVLLALWEGYARAADVNPLLVPAPSRVLLAFGEYIRDGSLLRHTL